MHFPACQSCDKMFEDNGEKAIYDARPSNLEPSCTALPPFTYRQFLPTWKALSPYEQTVMLSLMGAVLRLKRVYKRGGPIFGDHYYSVAIGLRHLI